MRKKHKSCFLTSLQNSSMLCHLSLASDSSTSLSWSINSDSCLIDDIEDALSGLVEAVLEEAERRPRLPEPILEKEKTEMFPLVASNFF